MKNPKVLKSILIASVDFYTVYGIGAGDNFDFLNKTKASGGAALTGGLLIMSGAFVNKPAEGFVQAVALEIITGLACIFTLVKYRGKQRVAV